MALLREYKYQLFAPKCNPSAEHANCLAALRDGIRKVFPCESATVKGCQHNPDAPFLRFRHEGHVIALRPRQAAAGRRHCFMGLGPSQLQKGPEWTGEPG